MAYPKSLQQPVRKNKLVVGAGFRCFAAPYNIALGSAVASTVQGPTIVDLSNGGAGQFDSYNPPAGFLDMGWIKDFKLTPGSKIGQVRSGYRGAVHAQYRGQVDETFEMKFREYGRLQYKFATGTNVINVLGATGQAGGSVGPLSASGAPTGAVTSYTAGTQTLTMASSNEIAKAQVGIGDFIVCDVDYNTATYGIVGDAGTPVFPNTVTDVDYIRKNSDYVARVANIVGANIILDQPFPSGWSGNPAPLGPGSVGSKIQKIRGWVAREGGTFIAEWTCLLMCNTVDQAQIVLYYPHVSILQNRDIGNPWAIENVGTTDLGGMELDAQYAALAFDDPLDGETVVSYKAYYPRPLESLAY